MTESEKAQAYDKAVERARQFIEHPLIEDSKNVATYILYGEEDMDDERIRKEIHIYLDWLEGRKEYAPKGKYTIKDMITWLEKQGGQKIAEWSEDLEKATVEAFKKIVDSDNNNFLEIFKAGAQWQKGQLVTKAYDWLYGRYNKQGYLDLVMWMISKEKWRNDYGKET